MKVCWNYVISNCTPGDFATCPLLSERYVTTLRSDLSFLLLQIRLSSVTFVRRTQGAETFGNIPSPFCTLAILWPSCKILRTSSQGTPSSSPLNARGVAKQSDTGHNVIPTSRSGISSPAELLCQLVKITNAVAHSSIAYAHMHLWSDTAAFDRECWLKTM